LRNLQIDNLVSDLTRTASFQALAARVNPSSGASPAVLRLSGLTPTARALYAILLHRATGRPQLIVVDGNKQADTILPLLQTFSDLIESPVAPLFLPALDVLPGQYMSPHQEILTTRASTLCQLANGYRGIVLAPVSAVLSRTEAPPYYRQLTQNLRVKDEIPLDDLALHLESVGYERRDPVEMVGEYSIRGGILDVFSPEEPGPVRVEFFGDESACSSRSPNSRNRPRFSPSSLNAYAKPVSKAASFRWMASRSPDGNSSSPQSVPDLPHSLISSRTRSSSSTNPSLRRVLPNAFGRASAAPPSRTPRSRASILRRRFSSGISSQS
jgi:hypothetical protein